MWLLGLGIRLGRLLKGVGSRVGGFFLCMYKIYKVILHLNGATEK